MHDQSQYLLFIANRQTKRQNYVTILYKTLQSCTISVTILYNFNVYIVTHIVQDCNLLYNTIYTVQYVTILYNIDYNTVQY